MRTAIVVACANDLTALAVVPSAATLNSASSAASICFFGSTSVEVSVAFSTSVRPTVISARNCARS